MQPVTATAALPKSEMIHEIKAKAWHKLRYTAPQFRAWVMACLQIEAYYEGVLEHASEADLGLMLDRLDAEIASAGHVYRSVGHDQFWKAARVELKVPLFKAREIVAAWTLNEVVNWPYAYDELLRRFGHTARVAA